tara:strand:- start:136 stop:915 length:780 start_codon:yes stop_codon:yes gene_type:complete
MDLKEIGEISRAFIEQYEELERSANRLLMSNSSTKLGDYKLRYQDDLGALDRTDFENFLNRGKHLTPILNVLTKKTTIKLRWSQYHPAPKALQLKIVLMRIVAGALLVYCDPLSFGYDAIVAGNAKPNLPNKQNKKRAEKLLAGLDKQGITLSLHTRIELIRISAGEYPKQAPDYIANNKRLLAKTLVREIAILSNALLIIDNKHANRLPIAITHKILSIVNASFSDEWVGKCQKLFDGQDDNALTDHMVILRDMTKDL